jgi:hypothetical protein
MRADALKMAEGCVDSEARNACIVAILEALPKDDAHDEEVVGEEVGEEEGEEGETGEEEEGEMELEKPDAAEMHLAKELVQDLERTGAKRSRIEEKSAKYEQFKKQQRLYPEYAGVYADTFLANPQALHHYQVPAATAQGRQRLLKEALRRRAVPRPPD